MNVLLATEDETLGVIMGILVSRLGYRVGILGARDLGLWKEANPAPDVLLLDVDLLGRSAWPITDWTCRLQGNGKTRIVHLMDRVPTGETHVSGKRGEIARLEKCCNRRMVLRLQSLLQEAGSEAAVGA